MPTVALTGWPLRVECLRARREVRAEELVGRVEQVDLQADQAVLAVAARRRPGVAAGASAAARFLAAAPDVSAVPSAISVGEHLRETVGPSPRAARQRRAARRR